MKQWHPPIDKHLLKPRQKKKQLIIPSITWVSTHLNVWWKSDKLSNWRIIQEKRIRYPALKNWNSTENLCSSYPLICSQCRHTHLICSQCTWINVPTLCLKQATSSRGSCLIKVTYVLNPHGVFSSLYSSAQAWTVSSSSMWAMCLPFLHCI